VPLAWCALESAEKVASAWYPLLMYTLDALEQLESNNIINQVL
jgi:hypothetical protein